MSSLTSNQIQQKYLVEDHQPTYLTKMKKKSLVLTPFLLKNGKKGKNKKMLPRFVIYLQQHVHIQNKKEREFWKNRLPNLTLNPAINACVRLPNVLHLGHKAITQSQGPLSNGLL